MCGFVGYTNRFDGIENMLNTIHHRGPDSIETLIEKDINLGFARLKIIDLSNCANQPMIDKNTNSILVFNGEIYNYLTLKDNLKNLGYTFETNSDTEVLLKHLIHFGKDGIKDLRGMFAFAFIRDGKILLGRDHFGIKPLYYVCKNGELVFGSELKALIKNPLVERQLNTEMLLPYTMNQHTFGEKTFIKDINRLPNGHFLEFDINTKDINIKKYFEFDFSVKEQTMEEAVTKIRNVLKESVELHKRADVKVGAFLSGGIDSSYVVKLAAPDITFSVGFSEEDGNFDESIYAKELSEMLGIKNVRKLIDKYEVLENLDTIIYYLDEPQANLSSIPLYFLSELARKHVTVVLSGEGADELFGGYQAYTDTKRMNQFKNLPDFLKKFIIKINNLTGVIDKEKIDRAIFPENHFIGEGQIASLNKAKTLISNKYHDGINPFDLTKQFFSKYSKLESQQLIDLNFFMQNDILLKADRMSMAHSLELRVPFLDVEVFKVSSTLSDELKIDGQKTKIALRNAAKKELPEAWYNRKKKGFPVPFRYWLYDDKFFNRFKEVFTSKEAEKFYDTKILMEMLNNHRDKKELNQRVLYSAYVFLIWYENFIK